MAQIFIFGDSITYGTGDNQGGWAQRLKTLIDGKVVKSNFNYYHEVYSLGICGDTTKDILERFCTEINVRLSSSGAENIIIVAIGTNDSQYMHDLNVQKIDKKKFEENINSILNYAKRYSDRIIFLGLTPVDEKKVDPIPWSLHCSYKNECIEEYNQILKAQTEKEKVHFIDIHDKFRSYEYKNLLVDGVHPNAKGHEIIYEQVLKYLTSNRLL